MKSIVIYKSKYGSTKTYAEWIASELSCEALDAKNIKADSLLEYDNIIYGGGLYAEIKVFNYLGKMIVDELSLVHKTAIKSLKKLMSGKKNPTEMEKLLIDLCDFNDDCTDREAIKELVDYIKEK